VKKDFHFSSANLIVSCRIFFFFSLIVDVKLSANRNARIRISHGDDPVELANKFAKIYSLDKDATKILETVLRQSMIQRGILPDPNKIVARSRSPRNHDNDSENEEEEERDRDRDYGRVRRRSSSRDRRQSYDSAFGSTSSKKHHHHRRHHSHRRSRRHSSLSGEMSNIAPEMMIAMSPEEDELQQMDPIDASHTLNNTILNGSNDPIRSNSGPKFNLAASQNPDHNQSNRLHRLDTDHSEMFGDTSMGVVEDDDYSSYTESTHTHSSDEESDVLSDDSAGNRIKEYRNPLGPLYRHDESDHNFSMSFRSGRNRDRSSILSELL
jgi:hypothetical protein